MHTNIAEMFARVLTNVFQERGFPQISYRLACGDAFSSLLTVGYINKEIFRQNSEQNTAQERIDEVLRLFDRHPQVHRWVLKFYNRGEIGEKILADQLRLAVHKKCTP